MNGLYKAITSGRVPNLPSTWSRDLNSLVNKCLQQSPRMRPTAAVVMETIQKLRPEIADKFESGRINEKPRGLGRPASAGDLLKTIKMPVSMFQINQRLPKKNYEEPKHDYEDDPFEEDLERKIPNTRDSSAPRQKLTPPHSGERKIN